MFSQKATYVTLINANRNKSIEKTRQAYLGTKKLPSKRHLILEGLRSNSNNNHKIGTHSTDRSFPANRSQSINTLPLRRKIKLADRNASINSKTNRHQICLTGRKTEQSVIVEENYQNEERRKNELGQNCRICILQNGKTLRQHFIVVKKTNQIMEMLSKKQNMNFITIPRQLPLQIAMCQPNISGEYLNGSSIYLKPQFRLSLNKYQLNLGCFQLIRPIGAGGFSQVFLTRSKIDNQFYALKLIEKQMIIKNKKQKLVMNQRNIMVNCHHSFVVELKYAFESQKYLAFVMEYCGGGELFGLIKKYHRLQEETAKFYIIQIFLGLQYLHSQKVVYRDIKPENILLGSDGHVKIADLGLAKPNMFNRTLAYSFCGSPEYMSPEMIMQVGHTYPVDYYCMGALLYQLLTGLPPFYSHEPEQIYEAVISQQLTFPADLSLTSQCKSLLNGLLCKDPKLRLGSLCGVKQILSHPWFGKQKYDKFIEKEIKPPKNFCSIDHFSTVTQPELSQKNKKVLQSFLKEQKKQKTDFEHIFKKFRYEKQDQKEILEPVTSRKDEKKIKIPLIYSNRKKTFEKQNRSSRHLKKQNPQKVSQIYNCLTYR